MGNTISEVPGSLSSKAGEQTLPAALLWGGSATIKSFLGIKVLNLEDAYEEMAINETQDQYLRSCKESPPNLNALHKIYLKPCKPPATTETMSNVAVASIPASLVPSTIRIGVFEDGLPHTRPPSTIWFPESLLRKGSANFNETFLHECIHLHQREHEDLWDKFYREQWNFIRYKGTIPKEIEDRRRLNPDTLRAPFYAWNGPSGPAPVKSTGSDSERGFASRGPYVPVVVYRNPEDADLSEVRLIFVRPNGSWSAVLPPGWMEFFGTQIPSICEHPHEMAAYILSDNSNPFDSEAAHRLRNIYMSFNRGRK